MATAQQQQIADQQRAEAVRQQAMELQAKRQSMELLRQQQRARATSLATTTAQGAAQGSGLPGAYGQTSGAVGNNLLGIQQSVGFSNTMFGINSSISQDRIAYAGAQGNFAAGQGLSSLGGALLSSASALGNIGGTVGNWFSPSASGGTVQPPLVITIPTSLVRILLMVDNPLSIDSAFAANPVGVVPPEEQVSISTPASQNNYVTSGVAALRSFKAGEGLSTITGQSTDDFYGQISTGFEMKLDCFRLIL